MKRNHLIVILLSVIFFSCASQKYTVAPEYLNKKITDGVILIPTIDRIRVNQDDQIFSDDELSKIETETFKLLGNNFKDKIRSISTISDINYIEFKNKPVMESKILDLDNGEKIYINVPKEPVSLSHSGNVYLLFLEDVNLSLIKEHKETSDPAKHYSASATEAFDLKLANSKIYNFYWLFRAKFFIYDNTNGKIVSYGSSNVKQKYVIQSDIDGLVKKAIEKTAKDIIYNTPFEK